MKRPLRLLDLFSGAGGAAVGYARAGFTDITGVDNRPMPRYPFRFIQADALEFLAGVKPGEYDLIHASPPCQAYTALWAIHKREHSDLLAATRTLLLASGCPWVIENVTGAPVHSGVRLCGTMFPGLRVFRHRWFETSDLLMQPEHPRHTEKAVPKGTYADTWDGFVTVTGGGNTPKSVSAAAMGIEWMTRGELAQAIPPAYTHFIGSRMLEALQ